MICEKQQPGNVNCKNCQIKRLLSRDEHGTYYLNKTDADRAGLQINIQPANAWIGRPKQNTINCRQGEHGIIAVVRE